MATYFVERWGNTNASNSLGWIGSVEARGEQAAEAAAAETFSHDTYDGQYLRVRLASKCGRAIAEEVAIADESRAMAEAFFAEIFADVKGR